MTANPPMPRPLISASQLLALLSSGQPCVLLDCGFDLADPAAGERAYAAGHLPGALYVHLDRDLSGPKTGRNGRHPLPERAALAERAGAWGIAPDVPVVCYDAMGMPYAARAWWLLRWLGHEAVAVLDGGTAAWLAAGGTLDTVPGTARPQGPYPARLPAMPMLQADELLRSLGRLTVLDARAAERFRGEVEPLDPVAGHIPGALNRPFADNLDASSGCFKPPAQLRAEFDALLAGRDAAGVVHHCGSGVSAVPNVLAMELAGYAPVALYAGSWSEWCRTPGLPVERG